MPRRAIHFDAPGRKLTGRFLPLLAVLAAAHAGTAAAPNFYASHLYDFPSQIAVGDLNGDGYPDIVGGIETVRVLLGGSEGIFHGGPQSPACPYGGTAPALADFNADGKLDLAFIFVPTGQEDELRVCPGNGDGSFQGPSTLSPINDILSGPIVTGDFNGDHKLDIAVEGFEGVWLLLGNGDGTFQTAVLAVAASRLGGIAAADFNGDGKPDLALSMETGVAVMLGNGNGSFEPPLSVTTEQLQIAAVFDVNLDGKPDLLLVNVHVTEHALSLYLGNDDGTFSDPTYPSVPGNRHAAFGDVNLDGKPDLVTNGFTGGLLNTYIGLGNGKGKFGDPASFPASYPTDDQGAIFLVSLRNNGRLDIVEAGDPFVSVMLNGGEGIYDDGDLVPAPLSITCGAVADFNRDGNPDLAVAIQTGFSILNGTGSASAPFTNGPTTPVSGDASCLSAGDFNHDGIPDLLVSNVAASEAVSEDLYLGNGDGTFRVSSSTPAGPTSSGIALNNGIAIADFNHDGNLDFAGVNNMLVLGNGDGTFQTPIALIPSCTPSTCQFSSIAAADLNNDGWPDLAVLQSNGTLWILLNNQQGGFMESQLSGLSGTYFTVGDLNGDGNQDLFVDEEGSSKGSIYLGDGSGGFTYKGTLSVAPAKMGSALIADINGDGIPDIEITCGATAVFVGKGDGTFESPFYLGPGVDYYNLFSMDLHGQAPGSGVHDLVYTYQFGYVVALINKTK